MDVLGVVTAMGEVSTVTRKSDMSEFTKRELTITDRRCAQCEELGCSKACMRREWGPGSSRACMRASGWWESFACRLLDGRPEPQPMCMCADRINES